MIRMVDRASYQTAGARTRHHQKPVDFLTRNRRAIRERSHADSEKRGGNATPRQHSASSRGKPLRHDQGRKRVELAREETVTISKGYLDQLMRMSVMADKNDGGSLGGDHDGPKPSIAPAHVILNHTQVPGLTGSPAKTSVPAMTQQHRKAQSPRQILRKAEVIKAQGREDAVPQGKRGLSTHEQWLRDLAAQAEEQRRSKEREKERRRTQAPSEPYFPFGRPGGGAPIKSQSGTLLTDYRTRGRVEEEISWSKDYSNSTPTHNGYTHYNTTLPPSNPHPTSPRHSVYRNAEENPANQKNEQWLRELAVQADEQRRRKDREREGRTQTLPEEYYPYGRPGGGAPIKSQSGELLTDFRTRGRVGEETDSARRDMDFPTPFEDGYTHHNTTHPHPHPSTLTSPRRSDVDVTRENPSNQMPSFARGAGPYVDRFVMEQKAQQRQKDSEHMEYIRAQIAEKERKKHEEKERERREEREIEERLTREGNQLQRHLREEKEKAQKKEKEKAERIQQLQQRVAEAEEEARRAKEETRLTKKEPHRNGKQRERGRDRRQGPPQEEKKPTQPRRTDRRNCGRDEEARRNQHPALRRKDEEGRGEQKPPPYRKLPSRIPIKSSSVKRQHPDPVTHSSNSNTPTRFSRVTAPSKRRRAAQFQPGAVGPELEVLPVRLRSPPVPALARKLGVDVAAGKVTAHQRALDPSPSPPPPPPPPPRKACPSPPVPALARKLALYQPDATEGDSAVIASETHTVDYLERTLTNHRPTSPPVPAVSKRLQSTTKTSSPVLRQPSSQPQDHELISDCLPINRPPSCAPDATPLPPSFDTETDHIHLPPLVTSAPPSQSHRPTEQPSRQERILQQLAVLRHGIISQKLDMDSRVNQILFRKTQSGFL